MSECTRREVQSSSHSSLRRFEVFFGGVNIESFRRDIGGGEGDSKGEAEYLYNCKFKIEEEERREDEKEKEKKRQDKTRAAAGPPHFSFLGNS